jgi:hypothetical protein
LNAILLGALVYAALRFVGVGEFAAAAVAVIGVVTEMLWSAIIHQMKKQEKWIK